MSTQELTVEVSKSFDAEELEFSGSEDSFDPHAPMFPTEPTYVLVKKEMLEEISTMLEYTQRVAPLRAIGGMKEEIDKLIAAAGANASV